MRSHRQAFEEEIVSVVDEAMQSALHTDDEYIGTDDDEWFWVKMFSNMPGSTEMFTKVSMVPEFKVLCPRVCPNGQHSSVMLYPKICPNG